MNKRQQIQILLRVLLPGVLLVGIMLGSFRVSRASIKAGTSHSYVQATVTEITADYSEGQPFNGAQTVMARITSGTWKGQQVMLSNSNSYQQGAFCQVGTKIVAIVQLGENGELSGSVYNYDRTGMVYLLTGLFLVGLVLVGGRKGLATIWALVFTFGCVAFLYVPLLYCGMNGILAGTLTAVVILAVSLYILNGWSSKTRCSMVGTALGVMISGGAATLLGTAGHLNGFHALDAESMVYIANASGLKVGTVLYAGILISCLGAVMDVSVSITAALEEVHAKAPTLSMQELIRSGLTVGHDMIGTMSNTLILAYTGTATGTLLTIYAYEMSYIQMMSYNAIIIEILSGLCGTIGVILTVPIQTVITSFVITSKRKKH